MNKVLGLFTCYNRREKTRKCLESLISDNNLEWRFIAFDDGSSDGTKTLLEGIEQVEVLTGDGSNFYSGGMRAAIALAKELCRTTDFDYILLFNDDVEFFENSISQLINYLGEEKAVMVGATSNDSGQLSYGGVTKKSNWKPKFEIVMSQGEKFKCNTFNANCVLLPKDVFLNVDNIDPIYRHSLGDFDYGLSAAGKGYVIYVSDFFVGNCNDNSRSGTWLDTSLGFGKRLSKKESVKGQPFKIWFHFLRKNYNFVSACLFVLNDYFKILIRR